MCVCVCVCVCVHVRVGGGACVFGGVCVHMQMQVCKHFIFAAKDLSNLIIHSQVLEIMNHALLNTMCWE